VCRWVAYSGSPVLIKELLLEPRHSLIDQSLHSRLGAETTNGDGESSGVFHSPLGFGHIRLSDESRVVVSEPLGDLNRA
jgi:predicted glutamine amidotransferase